MGLGPEAEHLLEELRAVQDEATDLHTHDERVQHREEVEDALRRLQEETRDPELRQLLHEVLGGRMSRFTLYGSAPYQRWLEDRGEDLHAAATVRGVDPAAATREVLARDGQHERLELMDRADRA